MPREIKLLIVEDNRADAELLVRSLRRADFEPTWQRVEDEKSYIEHLHSGLDLVVSDFELPGFNGFRALELLTQRALDIPFIIVSGTIGEETAVEAMKQGAADYLLKDRLARLGASVTLALEKYQMRRERTKAAAALIANEARFHGTLDVMLEGCQILGYDWRYLYVNATAAAHGLQKRENLIGRTIMECYPGFEYTEVFGTMQACMTGRKGVRVENEFARRDGSTSWFELSIQPVPEGIFILSLDITERKLAGNKIKEQLDELLRWQNLMIGREDRVQALKAEVNELLAEQKRPPRYTITPAS